MKDKGKLRGLRRRGREIERWRKNALQIDMDRLMYNQYNHQKIYVYPWSNLFCYKQPLKHYRSQITEGLIDIFLNWKTELEKLEQPYYLKIWLYYPHFMQSQVVAAIGSKIEHYDTLFPLAGKSVSFPIDRFAVIRDKLHSIKWQTYLEEEIVFDSDIGDRDSYSSEKDYNQHQNFLKSIRESPDRTNTFKSSHGEDIYYCKTIGTILCGE